MFIVSMLSWWYTVGWRQRLTILQRKLEATSDYFSIDLLAKTLFSPFRQISAGKVRGPMGVQLRAFADRLISRFIGAMIRSTIIIVGLIYMFLYAVFGGLTAVFWVVVPFLPVAGAALWIAGWVPWSL